MATIAVMGASGNIGGRISEQLLAGGHNGAGAWAVGGEAGGAEGQGRRGPASATRPTPRS